MLGVVYTLVGEQGLFELISHGNNSFIMKELATGKLRSFPIRIKSIRVDEVMIYTTGEDVSILSVFQSIYEKEGGKQVVIPEKNDKEALLSCMERVYPKFDKRRVYPSNIYKLLKWYNLLVSVGKTDFSLSSEEEKEEQESVKEKE